jgi:hypothetical protein
MLRKYTILLLVGLITLTLGFSKTAFSQNDIKDKIEKIKLEKMVKKMELDDAAAAQFKDKYTAFSNTMKELTKKRAKAYIEMTLNIESGNGLDSLVSLVLDYENQINQLRLNFVSDLKSMLTSKQIAVMIVFERRFKNQLQKLLQEYQKKNKQGIGE